MNKENIPNAAHRRIEADPGKPSEWAQELVRLGTAYDTLEKDATGKEWYVVKMKETNEVVYKTLVATDDELEKRSIELQAQSKTEGEIYGAEATERKERKEAN